MLLFHDKLGRKVERRAALGSLGLSSNETCAKSKVGEFQLSSVAADQEVLQLDVAVKDVVFVAVLEGREHLPEEKRGSRVRESVLSAWMRKAVLHQVVEETGSVDQLHHDANSLGRLDDLEDLRHVLVGREIRMKEDLSTQRQSSKVVHVLRDVDNLHSGPVGKVSPLAELSDGAAVAI